MKIVYFTHSLQSCWNHGNAHFLRGVLSDLIARGHEVSVWEPRNGWSLDNLIHDHGAGALDSFRQAYPGLRSSTYGPGFDPAAACDGADVVIVHEWTDPALVSALGRVRRRGGRFILLFHDTHHRAVSHPQAIRAFDLSDYDGVLAFGAALAEVYRDWGWGARAFVWHEAADTKLFKPPADEAAGERDGIVWIGNWGDGERTEEIETFLLDPARKAGCSLDVHGVRYPVDALRMLAGYGAPYHGWLPNPHVPAVFARHMATVHVPRRFYARMLPGIPTIRVFEALACGIPLVSAPWEDSEGLFRPGEDYLIGRDSADMTRHIRQLRNDPDLRDALRRSGLQIIRDRHSCRHRVDQLLAIVDGIGTPVLHEAAVSNAAEVS